MPLPAPRQCCLPNPLTRRPVHNIAPFTLPPIDQWKAAGAPGQRTYSKWHDHLSLLACLHMAVFHRDGHAPALWALLTGARAFHAFTTGTSTAPTGPHPTAVTDYIRETHHIPTLDHSDLTPDTTTHLLREGHLVITQAPHARTTRAHYLLLTGQRDDGSIALCDPAHPDPAALPAHALLPCTTGYSLNLLHLHPHRHRTAPALLHRALAS
ncbi:hypothetical protein [Streptomyces zagrosensis]|uniref:Peptidase C39-like domain-containing protein n=1 Tax=Streptomyces zagrosensis TaxID=1042984 RepID=A0A7W9QEJ5_9ACTN|nr:hypothetical protein [Streptomyces zagrosensis]MBB5938676.1 hypothetical protein [Streptomyces zagrosensis]